MVLDKLINFQQYTPLHPHFNEVRKFLNSNDLSLLSPGRHDIYEGSFVSISEYPTREIKDCFIECHRRYIDIQVVIEGKEAIGICNKAGCLEEEYNEEKDFQVLKGEVDFIT